MNSWEQWFIFQKEIYIHDYKEDTSFIISDHIAETSGYDRKEIRYAIYGVEGISYLPASLYESYMRTSCPKFQSYYIPTRKFKRELDKTYFPMYDDAEEVLKNTIRFYQWACQQKDKKTIQEVAHLTRKVSPRPDFEAIRQSQNGLAVKRRSELSPLARTLVDERDLL